MSCLSSGTGSPIRTTYPSLSRDSSSGRRTEVSPYSRAWQLVQWSCRRPRGFNTCVAQNNGRGYKLSIWR
eukprot:8434759-Prorocentrum_lima.AAC.1